MAAMTISTGWLGRKHSPADWTPQVVIAAPQPLRPQGKETFAPQRREAGNLSSGGQETRVVPGQTSERAEMSPEEPRSGAERAAAQAEQAALADLVARCLAGDAEAWEKLARSQQRRVYGICYRFTNSQTDAEDLTQDAFLKMYRNLGNFDPSKGAFTTWLTTLTRNMLVDNYRRSRMDRVSDSLDEPFGEEDDGPTRAERLVDSRESQEKHVAGLELRTQIQAALQQVSPELREAVILRDLEDMDYKDIADVLGVPQGTVKSRISRGRSELAKLLKRIEGQVM
ncbi:MAG: sigma-70 family RNA polymerase sigma factor [Acidobacteriaceae bacterium]|nr:sigma-70 family RNA polymerase sigma factor [Acidobacteriaceae bacterium]